MNNRDTPPQPETAADTPVQPDAAAAPKASTSLDRELAEMKDRLLRTLADMENMRKRTDREVADARVYGISNFARDILGVADNMHRAMQALDDELRANADDAVKSLLDGVELTERELMNVLEKNGVKKLDPMGQKFDPNRHQAMFEMEDASVPSGTVVQVMQAGYTIGERVLRPALVAVSKGGAKAAPAASANDNPTQ
ncbi:nucleotide exchange factor GrpE [Rhodoplanes sp. Z2-YC6860]|uniref:nucleotide exchange factor GrpE n=1 Tax=Rhodoplanes sp. Z2-YC6860 TaxID=674703 RepID=UPI00078CC42D|nr:nucleotide exchange factor GrpE [Rhodoplanes sp. Z2-YC6860]AMN38757.1 heat shock protein GrpE [Rhodoplanes sp. Z2-YC6860]